MRLRHAITPIAAAAVALSLGPTAAAAQNRGASERAPIVGNRELPKVIYIVPWKKPQPGEISGKPVHSVLDELLVPIDRDAFRRQLSYARPGPATTPSAPGNARSTSATTPEPETRP